MQKQTTKITIIFSKHFNCLEKRVTVINYLKFHHFPVEGTPVSPQSKH
jgi:hypothetical protein